METPRELSSADLTHVTGGKFNGAHLPKTEGFQLIPPATPADRELIQPIPPARPGDGKRYFQLI